MFNFESFIVYQKAFNFSKEIYSITKNWPREHLFGITSQIQRASLSIPLNIAEGSSRTRNDFRHFLIISRGSYFECATLLAMAKELNLIDESKYKEMYDTVQGIAAMLSKFRTALKD